MIKNLTKTVERYLENFDNIRECECTSLGLFKDNSVISLSVLINLFDSDLNFGSQLHDSGNMIFALDTGKPLLETGFSKINRTSNNLCQDLADDIKEIVKVFKTKLGKMRPNCLLVINVELDIYPDSNTMDYSSMMD